MNAQTIEWTTHDQPELGEEEAEFIAAIRRGDGGAFEATVTKYAPQMLALAKRLLRDEHDAADAVQEAFICAFRKGATFQGQSKLGTWLHRITVNACLMQRRSSGRRKEVNVDDLQPTFDATGHHTRPVAAWEPQPLSQAVNAELQAQVRACIDELPETYRTVLVLRDIEEVDTEEAARLLNCSEGCIKTRLHRARGALRTLLEPHFT